MQMCAHNCQGVARLQPDQKDEGSEPIQQYSKRELVCKLRTIQMFKDKRKPIPEVKVGLPWTAVIQSASPDMINSTFSGIIDFMTCAVEFPTQINLLHMSKKIFIQSVELMI